MLTSLHVPGTPLLNGCVAGPVRCVHCQKDGMCLPAAPFCSWNTHWNITPFLTTSKSGLLWRRTLKSSYSQQTDSLDMGHYVTEPLSQAIHPWFMPFSFTCLFFLLIPDSCLLSYTDSPLLRTHCEWGEGERRKFVKQTLFAFVSSVLSISCSFLGF